MHDFDAAQAARDAAYDNAGAVAESGAFLASWREATATLRAARPDHLDLAYGPRERNRFDLFPAGEPGAPCLVFIHGGYWQRNAKEVFGCMADGALARGLAAALPGYTLAPGATLTEIVAELRAALDWLGANGPARGVAGPVILSGWSAGGHLTAMLLDHPTVVAGLAISGVFELGPLRGTKLDAALRLTDAEIETLSPMRLAPSHKRLDLSYGTAELPALQANSLAFHGKRMAAECPGRLLPAEGANHFDILEGLRTPEGRLTRAVAALARG